jgi:hypothetical protein
MLATTAVAKPRAETGGGAEGPDEGQKDGGVTAPMITATAPEAFTQ